MVSQEGSNLCEDGGRIGRGRGLATRAVILAGCMGCLVFGSVGSAWADPPAFAPGSSADGYPPTTHFATSCANKCETGRQGNTISHVVFAASEAQKAATLASWQFDPGISTHYVVANDGSVADMVAEADTAWEAGDDPYNQTSICVVVEGFVSTPSSFGDLEYQRAAQLTAAIAYRYKFPIDAAHVLGRGDIPTSTYAGQGPGPSFDFGRLRALAQAYRDELDPPAITSPIPPPAVVSQPYSIQYSAFADNGVGFAVSSGSLPDGLTLSYQGQLSGTPTRSGTFSYTVTATRPSGLSASRVETLTVLNADAGSGSQQVGTGTNGPPYTLQSLTVGPGGTVTIALTPKEPGTATLTVTVPTASVSNKGHCQTGRTLVKRKCAAINTIVGVARGNGRPGVRLVLKVNPTGRTKAALNRGKTLRVLATLVYRPLGGGRASSSTRRITLRGKHPIK